MAAKFQPVKVMGADLSLNHAAFVELTDGKMTNFQYVTDLAGSAKQSKRGTRLPGDFAKVKDPNERNLRRLVWWEHFLDKQVLMPMKPDYIGVEDYALDARQGHMKGELGGIARILCWFRGIPLRLHDPISVKMFATHDGTAQKDLVEKAVLDRWGVDFGSLNHVGAKGKTNHQTSEDLADAYTIAQLVWYEVQLRRGSLTLDALHEKEVRVFNRITKTYPVNLLDRDWIHNKEGTPTPHGEPVCQKCGSRKCCLAKKGHKQ